MNPARTTIRLASAFALLAILLRVLLPALHTHRHVSYSAGSSQTASSQMGVVCSCGAVHSFRTDADERDQGEEADAAPRSHSCLACQLEEGTPGGCPPEFASVESLRPDSIWHRPATATVVARQLVELPQPRAPPADRI